jgi:hypothetical protein
LKAFAGPFELHPDAGLSLKHVMHVASLEQSAASAQHVVCKHVLHVVSLEENPQLGAISLQFGVSPHSDGQPTLHVHSKIARYFVSPVGLVSTQPSIQA